MEKQNIMWYEDDELAIGFSDNPHVCIRYILPSSTPDEVKSIKKYPFICKTNLKVTLFDHEKEEIYTFTIPKGYCYDGATIPKFFWRVIGSSTDNSFLVPALIHDILTENHHYVNNDRNFSSKVFRALLVTSGVSEFKAQIMYLAVDNFQRFCKW